MDEITLYHWGVLGFLALIAVLIWRVLLAVEAVEKNTLQDNGSPASSVARPGSANRSQESACVTDLEGPALYVVPQRTTPDMSL